MAAKKKVTALNELATANGFKGAKETPYNNANGKRIHITLLGYSVEKGERYDPVAAANAVVASAGIKPISSPRVLSEIDGINVTIIIEDAAKAAPSTEKQTVKKGK